MPLELTIEEKIKQLKKNKKYRTTNEQEKLRMERTKRRKEAREKARIALSQKQIKKDDQQKLKKDKEILIKLKERDEKATITNLKKWILVEKKTKDQIRVELLSHPELYQNVDRDFIAINVQKIYGEKENYMKNEKDKKRFTMKKKKQNEVDKKLKMLGGFDWRR
jgi:hypothetical protein